MKPEISVIMPAHNEERFIGEAIRSILNQTFGDFELIVVDDASTDGTVHIVHDDFGDDRIRLIQLQKSHGPSFCRNFGALGSRGEYIALQDADDMSKIERLRTQRDFLRANEKVGLVGTYAEVINEKGRFIRVVKRPEFFDEIKRKLIFGNAIIHASSMITREALASVGLYEDAILYEDYDLIMRMARKFELRTIPQPLYMKRVHSDQRSCHRPLINRLVKRPHFLLRALWALRFSPIQVVRGVKEKLTKRKEQNVDS